MKTVFILANTVLAAILVALVAWQASRDRNQVIEASYRDLEQVTATLAEHTQQTLTALDLGLAAVALQGFRGGMSGDEALTTLGLVVQNRQAAASNTYAFYVLDAEGDLLLTSRTDNPDSINLADLEEFQQHRDVAGNQLHVSLPRPGRVGLAENQWILPLSRRIPSATGGFAGISAAALSLDYLVEFYNAVLPGPGSSVGLINAQGKILARSPFDATLMAGDFYAKSIVPDLEALPEDGRLLRPPSDGEAPLMAVISPTWNDALYVYATLDEQQALQPWLERLLFKLGIIGLVLLMSVTGSIAIWFFIVRKHQWIDRTLEIQKQAMAQVEAAKAEIETIFNSISDAVFALDREWCFSYLNAEAERLLERPKTELLGKNVWQEFPEAAGTAFETHYTRTMEEGVPIQFEQYYPPLHRWFMVRAFPQRNGITVYFQDYTSRHEMEERMRQSQKMDALGQLTGGIAHDFNNLLTVILGNIDDVMDALRDKPQAIQEQADVIRMAGERAAELTHRLLAFARRQPLDPRPTNVNDLVMEVKQLLRRTVTESIHIELVRSAGAWPALVDSNELQNAVLNLALNARDAMPEGGRLTIETGNIMVDEDYAEQNEIPVGSYVLVAVSDTGHGMTPEQLSHAFDPFFTTKSDARGTGLGLAMVYGFARQSGGHVKMYSEVGEGTTVRLYLPRAQDENEQRTHRKQSEDKATGSGERILVVEDDELVRQYTVRSLEQLGYEVTSCQNGVEALEMLRKGNGHDLLLTDVVLTGGISGKEVAIEALALWPQIRVLYMSGYTENAIVHHGRLDPGVNLLSKPFRLGTLAKKIREVLEHE